MFDLSIFIECLNLISMSLLRMSRTLDMRAEMEREEIYFKNTKIQWKILTLTRMEDPNPNADEHQGSMKDLNS
jgi:hypothetical protein